MRIGYVRVSTVDQNEDRQIEGLEKYGIEKWYMEKVSGKNMNREQLQEMLSCIKEGDTVYVHDFSRLARSTKDLLEIVEVLNKKGVHLVSNKENIDTSTPQGKLMVTMLAAIYEFERTNMLERQAEGIEIAKRKNIYKGRKPKDISKEKIIDGFERYKAGFVTKKDLAKEIGVSIPTLNKNFNEIDSGNGKK